VADFRGVNNSQQDDQAHGLALQIKLDEENFAEEYASYVEDADALNERPSSSTAPRSRAS
jgi:hypothetical protein